MKISSILRDLLGHRAGNVADAYDAIWLHDPYAHPMITAMTERERADLPPIHLPTPRPVVYAAPSRVAQGRFATVADR